MIKVLVTVGTTPFDELIRVLDKEVEGVNFFFQIGNGKYRPQYSAYADFVENIRDIYAQYDLIITHAGAGSVYYLLENGHKCLVIPNLIRADKHQQELGDYLKSENLASVSDLDDLDLVNLRKEFMQVVDLNHRAYDPERFFMFDELLRLARLK